MLHFSFPVITNTHTLTMLYNMCGLCVCARERKSAGTIPPEPGDLLRYPHVLCLNKILPCL